MFDIDFRVDQSPGIWLTAKGRLPRVALRRRRAPTGPVNVIIVIEPHQSRLARRGHRRRAQRHRHAATRREGRRHQPRSAFSDGLVDLTNAGFLVDHHRGALQERARRFGWRPRSLTVIAARRRRQRSPARRAREPGTRELRVADLRIEATARVRGDPQRVRPHRHRCRAPAPRPIRAAANRRRSHHPAGDVRVDEILERALFQPYATEAADIADTDPVARSIRGTGSASTSHCTCPNTLRLSGENVQVSPGTPIGLGDINLRVAGDLYWYKDAAGRCPSPDRSTRSAARTRFRGGGSTSTRRARSISAAI